VLSVKIAGLGLYLPPERVASAELERQLGLEEGWIERVTGVRERRRARAETASEMGAAAARHALADAGVSVDEVDLIVCAATGPQQLVPCTAALVQRALGAPDGQSACFDVNATCLSFLFGLQTAAHLIAAGAYRTALLLSSEITSRCLNPHEPESAVLFGDAAAAAVLTRGQPGEGSQIVQVRFRTWSSGADLAQVLGGGNLHHPNEPATTPEMNMFRMHGPAIFKRAVRLLGPFLDEFLAGSPPRDQFDAVIPHQASLLGVRQLSSRWGFRPEQVVSNLATRGNCIAASIPLGLAEAVQEGRVRRGDRVLLVGTGAGLSLGAVELIF
jgi:3-oxoacyl-[acyl-carrier-protein] synthase-3